MAIGEPQEEERETSPLSRRGTYPGAPMGRAQMAKAWEGQLAQERERVSDMATLGMPTVAAADYYRVHILPTLLYVAGIFGVPGA